MKFAYIRDDLAKQWEDIRQLSRKYNGIKTEFNYAMFVKFKAQKDKEMMDMLNGWKSSMYNGLIELDRMARDPELHEFLDQQKKKVSETASSIWKSLQ